MERSDKQNADSKFPSEYLVNTQPHARNKTYRIIVRDLTKNIIVNQISGGQIKKPWSIQVLQNGHLVIGYSTVRPWDYDFYNEEGQLYNHMESDCDKCWVLKNGLMVEVAGKQTIVKQVMPEFKPPRLIRVYDLAAQWVDLFEDGSANKSDILLAHTYVSDRTLAHLYVLRLTSQEIETVIPICITNIQMQPNHPILFGTTPLGDYIQKMDLHNWLSNGFVRTSTAPVPVRRQKINDIKLRFINDQFTLYKNAQKQHVRDIESVSHYLVDWKKQETIWHTQQDIEIIATSPNGYFVYFDIDATAYYLLVCGSSVVTPIPSLTNSKPKGESRFLSNGTFVFHGEKRIVVLDIDTSTILAQYDVSRHTCDLMTVSKFDYKPKVKPMELTLMTDVKDEKEAKVEKLGEDKEGNEIPPPPPPPLSPIVVPEIVNLSEGDNKLEIPVTIDVGKPVEVGPIVKQIEKPHDNVEVVKSVDVVVSMKVETTPPPLAELAKETVAVVQKPVIDLPKPAAANAPASTCSIM